MKKTKFRNGTLSPSLRSIMVILVTAAAMCLSGCFLGDFEKYDYIADHWKGSWVGWLEISDACGTYEKWDGIRIPCRAEMGKDYKRLLLVELSDEEGNQLGYLHGTFKDKENTKYGQVDIVEAIDSKNTSVKAQIQVDGESHGDENLGIMTGRIGDSRNGLDIQLLLRRVTEEEEREVVVMTVQSNNSGVNEFGEEVGFGEGDLRAYTVQEGDCFYEGFGYELLQNCSTDEDGIRFDRYMVIRSLEEDRAIVNTGGEDWDFPYGETRTLSSLIEVMDGPNTGYRITMERYMPTTEKE